MISLNAAKVFFGSNHPLFKTMDIDIASIDNGKAEMTMPFSMQLSDHRGALHRGALVTLLDTTSGLAIFSALQTLQPIATIDLRIDYLRSIPAGVGVRAVVDCIATTATVAFIVGKALAEGQDEPVAMVAGSFAIDTMGPSFDSPHLAQAGAAK
ncbi:MAG: PaaI family thioesterase [Aquabacterium sp.]|jgi:uncharacterized protein (TIGR00369 family)|uniref:PaaI family thioesterase n=1 Tax=Aquabacterium sp. TaxID=1872578 RepID=UPI001D9BBBE6|nr:PaaI family thioesterase [Aquabacterium sp.]MBT9610807.1 PaaI family thioesterase [Aquabacterium sp.]